MRSPDELLKSALAVIDLALSTPAIIRGRYKYTDVIAPLLSGGHDSICACHAASQHWRFNGEVFHIDTGIGSKKTRTHVEAVCRELNWRLTVLKSKDTYEKFIRERGFPGPAMHQWAYIRLKERCVRMIVKGQRVALITGCRQQESVRRMGHVEPVKVGELDGTTGKMINQNRVWTAPCFDWSAEEQAIYMDEYDLPKNPVKLALGMSGECFCGAFASPGELDRIRLHCPDVADEIDRLTVVAQECGKHSVWGTRPPKEAKGVAVAASGPLCSTCDLRAGAAGVVFQEVRRS